MIRNSKFIELNNSRLFIIFGFAFGVSIICATQTSFNLSIFIIFIFIPILGASFLYFPVVFSAGLITFILLKNHLVVYWSGNLFGGNVISMVDGAVIMGIIFVVVASKLGRRQLISFGSKVIWVPICCVLVIGFLSSIKNNVPVTIAFSGAYITSKGYLIFLIFRNLNFYKIESYFRQMLLFFLAFGIIALILGIVDLLEPIAFRDFLGYSNKVEYRWFLPSVQSIFSYPQAFALFMGFCAFASAGVYLYTGKRLYYFIAFAFLLGVFLAMRRKEIAGCFLSFMVASFTIKNFIGLKKAAEILLMLFLLIFLPFLIDANLYSRLIDTAIQDNVVIDEGQNARKALYLTGFNLANRNFPFGVGFGRFASYTAVKYYSPLYDETGLSSVYGLRPEDAEFKSGSYFLVDTFWPHIYTETGFIGFGFYLFYLFGIGYTVVSRLRGQPTERVYSSAYVLTIFMYYVLMLFSSFAYAIFEGPMCVLLFSGLGVIDKISETNQAGMIETIK